jgi:hypothetical protein
MHCREFLVPTPEAGDGRLSRLMESFRLSASGWARCKDIGIILVEPECEARGRLLGHSANKRP